MSEWEQLTKGIYFHGYCPGCGNKIALNNVAAYPELLKCSDPNCSEEWVRISGRHTTKKDQIIERKIAETKKL